VIWTQTDNGLWLPHLIVRNSTGAGGYELVDYEDRRPLPDPHGFQWDRALVLAGPVGVKERIVVPTATGVCAFAFDEAPDAILKGHQPLFDAKEATDRAIQLVMDNDGVIAYATNAAGNKGASGVARFAPAPAAKDARPGDRAYTWTVLKDWPRGILHLVPFRDGSVLQIVSNDEQEKDKITFSLNTVAASTVDEKEVLKLVDDLSSSDPDKREAAFKSLTTFGNGIAPILEKALEDQTPEAAIRIRQLLKNKIEPQLGSMTLVDGRMRVVNRLPDGGVIFHAEAGVAIPRADDTPTYVTPAWLSIRPGRPVELLPPGLTGELYPEKHKIIAWGYNDFVVQDAVTGPQWYLGNRLNPLLAKKHKSFTEFAGIDTQGRWLFREPPSERPRKSATTLAMSGTTTNATAATRALTGDEISRLELVLRTQDITTNVFVSATTQPSLPAYLRGHDQNPRTLIIDPRLPDTTPRLPAWQLPMSLGKVGWDKNHWPVIFMDVKPNPVPWALEESAWRVIDEKKGEQVFTDAKDIPALPEPPPPATKPATTQLAAATAPTTRTAATTTAATTQDSALSTADLGATLLVAPDGSRYYDGQQSIKILRPDGSLSSWILPQSAVGAGTPTLLRTRDGGLLFLFNAPGRIVRIRPTPDEEEPFTVDAVFTRNVPSDPQPLRIWMDPADRICIAHTGNRITVLFTIGRIPPTIVGMMGSGDLPPEDPDAQP
jgi:hypothetical protein